MIVVPQRLFSSPNVKVIARDGENAIIQKRLEGDLVGREAYVASHAISIVLRGKQSIETYEGNSCTIVAGELLVLPRGVYYVTDLLAGEGAFESLLFYFDDDTVRQFTASIDVGQVHRERGDEYLSLVQSTSIKAFATSLMTVYATVPLSGDLLRLKTLELLHLIAANYSTQQFANFIFRLALPVRRNIRPFMEANCTKPLSVADYAYLTGRSLSTFRRDFKAQFNNTPQRWIRERRIRHAIALLEATDYRVVDLAAEAGYQNVSYFIRAFKAQTGQSPKQYMLQNR